MIARATLELSAMLRVAVQAVRSALLSAARRIASFTAEHAVNPPTNSWTLWFEAAPCDAADGDLRFAKVSDQLVMDTM